MIAFGMIAMIIGLVSILIGGFILYGFYITFKEIHYVSILFILFGISILLTAFL